MYWGVSYILYTYNLHHNFGRALTVEKFNPPANFLQFKLQAIFAGCIPNDSNSRLYDGKQKHHRDQFQTHDPTVILPIINNTNTY